MAFNEYDFGKHTFSFNGIIITGFAEGTAIKAARNVPAYTTKVGNGGDVTRARSRNRTGLITFMLMKGSQSNDQLSAMQIADELIGDGVGPSLMKDLNGTSVFQCDEGWLTKPADFQASAEPDDVEWIIECAVLNIFIGGLVT